MAKKQFKAESKRLLDLMIHSIYTHKEIFLREIISNASDAIDKLCYLSLTDDQVGLNREDFQITVTVDKEARTLTVSDNGIGMTQEEMDKNLGVIAKSGSLQFKQELDEKAADEVDIIGQFGVGFYSAFMVADKVTVLSKAYGAETGAKWESTGADGYTLTECQRDAVGTDIIMSIKPDTEEEQYSEFLEPARLRQLIKKYSDYVRWPIRLDGETVNSQVPIWQRSKSEVSDADCMAFYKEKYFDTQDPVAVIRVSAEGTVSYKAMLFIPAQAPYDYYTKDYRAGLQLYTSGVMIMENCADLLPEHFRFVRGVVDSQDLSLNISREILQHDRQLKVIATSLEKKIKNELKRLMDQDREKYETFYKAFGLQLKYGIVSDFGAHKEMLSDLLLFHSAKEDKLISLADYAAAMPEEQKYAYYACGSSIQRIASLPQLEPIQAKGYDILYLTDNVDEFVMAMLGTVAEGKALRSVNEEDLGLESEAEEKATQEKAEENKDLLQFVTDSLDGRVVETTLSHKLKSHPVCLTTKGPVTLEMEKYFQSVPDTGGKVKAERVLELNGDHPAFQALQKAYAEDKDRAKDYAQLLYQQAVLIADLPLEDPAAYAELVCKLMV